MIQKVFKLLAVTVFLSKVWGVEGQKQCNMTHAETCLRGMEKVLEKVIDSATSPAGQDTVESVCLDIIKGNNLTQCYVMATAGCVQEGQSTDSFQPTETMMRWETVMQDIYNLCDGACPSFLNRTINITQCTGLIRFDALYESSFDTFCMSLNDSMNCAADVTEDCPMFARLFYDILPKNMDSTATNLCTKGCANFDESMAILDNCKGHLKDLPQDLERACEAYNDFQGCLRRSNAPVTCPMFDALLQVLFPKHIFGLYERECNKTAPPEDDSECGERGKAKIQHCSRILSLSWPVSTKEASSVSPDQCRDFETGIHCLDNAGFHRCPGLREYFEEITKTRHDHMTLMQERCADVLAGHVHREDTPPNLSMVPDAEAGAEAVTAVRGLLGILLAVFLLAFQ